MAKQKFIKASGIIYSNELKTIHKSGNKLQPIYEAFTNAWEAIFERFGKDNLQHGTITITFNMEESLFEGEESNQTLINIEVKDNGSGLNIASFKRLENLRDISKGRNNKGTGRVQYLHFFNKTIVDSVYKKGKSFEHTVVTLSKMPTFLKNNAIIRVDKKETTEDSDIGTKVVFEQLLDEKKDKLYYDNILPIDIKKELVLHFMYKFCENRERLPKIIIRRNTLSNNDVLEENIAKDDIPMPDNSESFIVNKSKLDEKNRVVDADSYENFELLAFCRPSEEIRANKIYLISDGALAQSINIDGLKSDDAIDGKRYIFLLRSEYFDCIDNDDRGNLALVRESDFKRQNENCLFPEECILIDNIKEKTNDHIAELYPCFKKKKEEAMENLQELKDLFLIDDEIIDSFKKKIKTSDNDEIILKSIYATDSEIAAKGDAELKKEYDALKSLNPEQADYEKKIAEHSSAVAKLIPQQNRNNLTKYIARREIVLKIFQMILDRELVRLKNGERINEAVLHNLIFRQSSNEPEKSDLWLLDDQYMYFKGCSESKLEQIEINGVKLIKENLSKEEKEYKNRIMYRDREKNVGIERPDVFLYPDEGKCIIVEFKAPDVDVSEHLNQINRYASIINNLSDERFNIHAFYGYLIGENINYENISDTDVYFKNAPHLNYIYRPNYPIKGKFNRVEGDLYTEIIKYSDILKRAKLRNKMFLEKLHGCKMDLGI